MLPRMKVPSKDRTSGPEILTLFERAVNRLHLPYPLVCLPLAITLGYTSSNFGESPLSWTLWVLLGFYMLYAIRHIRLKVVAAESALLPLCPQGEETFHRAFGNLSRPVLQALFMTTMLPITTFYFYRLFRFDGLFHLALALATIIIFSIAWGSVFWEYCSSIVGLHKLGREPLRLKSYHEDVALGLRPLGSLSFQLTFVYLSIIGLGSVATSFFADLFNIVALVIFAVLGAVLFFLPLNNVHRIMSEAKYREQEVIRGRQTNRSEHYAPFALEGRSPTLEEMGNFLADLRSLLTLDIDERKLSSVPTWPLESRILRQLTLTLMSVMGIITGRIIILALHL